EIRQIHETGRPILVGTVSIEKSELLSEMLGRYGIKHEVLNAKHHDREADIIAQAGRLKAVTIATNMAGRGTDIILGGNPDQAAWEQLKHKYVSRLEIPKSEWDALTKQIADAEGMVAEGRQVAELGGLHVIGTERHEARRIDLQLRGRSGRQGDPGSSRFFLSLEDDLMRIFAGDWVRNILTRLGMQEGEAIESGLVSRQIEKAQRRVEERHFEQRKSLLEYDEVMDQQRKRVYTFRQNILDNGDCRQVILDMLEKQVQEATQDVLGPNYGRETCAKWAGQVAGIEIEGRDIADGEAELVIQQLRDEAQNQADEQIRDKIDEDLPEDAEDQREWNWQSLSKWANSHWGLNTNDRELRKLERNEVGTYLLERAREAIDRADFSAVKEFLAPDFGRRSLSNWLKNQFTLDLPAERFADLTPDAAANLIVSELKKLYDRKEVEFPVAVGLSRFLAEQTGGEKYDREGLVRWANGRFQTRLDLEAFRGKARGEIQAILTQCSEGFSRNGDSLAKVEQFLDRAYGQRNGEGGSALLRQTEPVAEIVEWAHTELNADIDADDLLPLARDEARQLLVEAVDTRYRPELREAERSLVLHFLDEAWKQHLYYMDHLRQGIGLVGYAQKDPKVEYKREGMKAFEMMWSAIGRNITSTIFRLEDDPGFVGSLWRITSTTHAAPVEDYPEAAAATESESGGGGGGGNPPAEKAVDPIRNRGDRVGRNDPCPCGSGKKFKNCHMKK
ncbi:MAG: SEC-C domain-containing protein, partial [Planctomycetes bacterium]|nr:SEC-C domain-containing protein [Planctomycetota bacterium]